MPDAQDPAAAPAPPARAGAIRRLWLYLKGFRAARKFLTVTLGGTFSSEKSPAQLRRLARRVLYHNLLNRWDFHRLRKGRAHYRKVIGVEPLLERLEAGRGCIVGAPHLGPIHWLPLGVVEAGVRNLGLVATPQVMGSLAGFIMEKAREYECRVDLYPADNPRSLLKALRALKEGQVLLTLFDGNVGSGGVAGKSQNLVEFEFLRMPVRMRASAAFLAHHSQEPLLLAAGYRSGIRERTLEFSAPIPPPADGSPEALRDTTLAVFGWMERKIREHPAQWEGWLYPQLFWGQTGAAPQASAQELDAETQRIRGLLEQRAGALRCRSDPNRLVFLNSGDQPTIYEGPTRRILRLPPLAAEVVRLGFRRRSLKRLLRSDGVKLEELAPIVARLSLAGLVVVGP